MVVFLCNIINKRYRSQGYYNEERGTVQKGMYRSLYDFLSIPFKRDKELLGLNEEEVTALQSVQNVFKQLIDFTLHINTAYKLMPEYDKANIRRAISGNLTILATIAATIAINIIYSILILLYYFNRFNHINIY